MMLLFIFVVLAGVGALLWFQGLWSNVVTFVNLWLAALLAFSLTEPITNALDDQARNYGYLTDIIIVWVLFALIFGILRAFTDQISRTRLQFQPMVELVGRSVMSVVNAYVFTMFVCATLHAAPLEASPFKGAWPPNFIGLKPDVQFFQITELISRGSLEGTNQFSGPSHVGSMARRRGDLERLEGFLAP
ncbi:MAG: hypothetical protein KDB14_13105 [Planctomycetales bacterium]|nr:hypothetical protein [Planctomycetales bacterium]